ncbi:MAG TPA: RNA polymerase sigma-70 factor [Candidatus Limnocylindria bacterium]|jgi:RNA polymerase sigma-70 factor (ECF subfamily)|nr:RNA polymerase sigma-70 factor [Candidatus Limnocylindria bacterium]
MINDRHALPSDSPGDDSAESFLQHRPLLFSIAYRMLGSVAEAEDVVQDAYLRWRDRGPEPVQSAKALLTTIVTRLCLDHLKSAQHLREHYIGLWLPEPLEASHDPANERETESLTTAFLLLLETLSPIERAAFLLREVYDYDYRDIAAMVGKSEANCRQLVSRAREHLARRRPRFPATTEQTEVLLRQFLQSWQQGDPQGLLATLANESILQSDGGGKAIAAGKPVVGAAKICQFLLGVRKHGPSDVVARFAVLNAEPAVLLFSGGQLLQTMTFSLSSEGRIEMIYTMRNPDKLHRLATLSSVSSG